MVGCRFPLAMWSSPFPSLLGDLAKGERSAGGEETSGVVSNVPCPLRGFLKGHISSYWEDLFLYLGKNCQAGSCTFDSQLSGFFPSPEQGKSANVWLSSCLRNEAVLSLRSGLWRAKQKPVLSIVPPHRAHLWCMHCV